MKDNLAAEGGRIQFGVWDQSWGLRREVGAASTAVLRRGRLISMEEGVGGVLGRGVEVWRGLELKEGGRRGERLMVLQRLEGWQE